MEGEEGLEGLEKVFPRARMPARRGRARYTLLQREVERIGLGRTSQILNVEMEIKLIEKVVTYFSQRKVAKKSCKNANFFWVEQNTKPKGNAKTWKPTTDRHCFFKMPSLTF